MEINFKKPEKVAKNRQKQFNQLNDDDKIENISDSNSIEYEDKYFLGGMDIFDLPSDSDSSDYEFYEEYSDEYGSDDDDDIIDDEEDEENEAENNVNEVNTNNINKKMLIQNKKKNIREIFQEDYRNFFTANFLTLKA